MQRIQESCQKNTNNCRDLAGKFEFIYKDGKPFLKVIDPYIKRVALNILSKPVEQPVLVSDAEEEEEIVNSKPVLSRRKAIALVFHANEKLFPYLSLDVVQGNFSKEENKFTGLIEKLDLTKFINIDAFTEKEKQIIQHARKLQDQEINKYLKRPPPSVDFGKILFIHKMNNIRKK